ncbi:MAG: AAA family ATPase, partial [Gammaproteobacteria bacterium]
MGSTRRLVSGRVRELGVLQAEWRRSTRGELRVALMLGDAGLGKTLLATELLQHNHEVAVELIAHTGGCKGMPPFGPWADALGLYAGGPDADRVCRACGSGLRGLLALGRRCGSAHDAASCAQALRYHFVEWIPGLLATSSADRPIIVVLDNAHDSHDVVWEMLLRLSQDFPASHVFVLATARPWELACNARALEVLQALEHAGRIRRVQLASLGQDDVRELTADTLGRDRVPSALVDWLIA